MTAQAPGAEVAQATEPAGPHLAAVPAAVPLALLSVVVLCAGAGALATEISASRLLAPYFGNSTVVWANVIGLILIYLSVGYWIGGRVADRHASAAALGRILLVAAGAIAVLPLVAHPILRVALDGFDRIQVGAIVGSFFATLALFSLPVTLLGMVSPFALRLGLTRVDNAGAVSGRLSSLTTVGAIAGTFLPALVLIPAIGTQRTMIVAALVVALAATLLLGRRWLLAPLLIAAMLLLPPGAIKPQTGVIVEQETQYQYAQIARTPDGKIVMRLDDGVADQSVYRPGATLTGGEWDMPLVVPPLLDRPLRTALIIGNAGGTTARGLAASYPGVRIDGVELDPQLTQLARQYMGMNDIPGLRVITADGRTYLQTTNERYDLIVVDAYRQAYIPFQLVTQEFFKLMRDHLEPGGAVVLNVARVPGDDRLPRAVSGTLATVFPAVYTWHALHFNDCVIGFDHPLSSAALAVRVGAVPPALQSLVALVRAETEAITPSASPMTDDRAPVEWLTDRAVIEHVVQGGRFDEQLLPTRPTPTPPR
ncbi:MAG TPA: fused MFS/spermidine synthase [Candidatus Dormibacteraeota bacterium]